MSINFPYSSLGYLGSSKGMVSTYDAGFGDCVYLLGSEPDPYGVTCFIDVWQYPTGSYWQKIKRYYPRLPYRVPIGDICSGYNLSTVADLNSNSKLTTEFNFGISSIPTTPNTIPFVELNLLRQDLNLLKKYIGRPFYNTGNMSTGNVRLDKTIDIKAYDILGSLVFYSSDATTDKLFLLVNTRVDWQNLLIYKGIQLPTTFKWTIPVIIKLNINKVTGEITQPAWTYGLSTALTTDQTGTDFRKISSSYSDFSTHSWNWNIIPGLKYIGYYDYFFSPESMSCISDIAINTSGSNTLRCVTRVGDFNKIGTTTKEKIPIRNFKIREEVLSFNANGTGFLTSTDQYSYNNQNVPSKGLNVISFSNFLIWTYLDNINSTLITIKIQHILTGVPFSLYINVPSYVSGLDIQLSHDGYPKLSYVTQRGSIVTLNISNPNGLWTYLGSKNSRFGFSSYETTEAEVLTIPSVITGLSLDCKTDTIGLTGWQSKQESLMATWATASPVLNCYISSNDKSIFANLNDAFLKNETLITRFGYSGIYEYLISYDSAHYDVSTYTSFYRKFYNMLTDEWSDTTLSSKLISYNKTSDGGVVDLEISNDTPYNNALLLNSTIPFKASKPRKRIYSQFSLGPTVVLEGISSVPSDGKIEVILSIAGCDGIFRTNPLKKTNNIVEIDTTKTRDDIFIGNGSFVSNTDYNAQLLNPYNLTLIYSGNIINLKDATLMVENYNATGDFDLSIRCYLDPSIVGNFSDPAFSLVGVLLTLTISNQSGQIIGSLINSSFDITPISPTSTIVDFGSVKSLAKSVSTVTLIPTTKDFITDIKLITRDTIINQVTPIVLDNKPISYSFAGPGDNLTIEYDPRYGSTANFRSVGRKTTNTVRSVLGHKYCISVALGESPIIYFKKSSGSYSDVTDTIKSSASPLFIIPLGNTASIKTTLKFLHMEDGFNWGTETDIELPEINYTYIGYLTVEQIQSIQSTAISYETLFRNTNPLYTRPDHGQYGRFNTNSGDIYCTYPNINNTAASYIYNAMVNLGQIDLDDVSNDISFTGDISVSSIPAPGSYVIFVGCIDELGQHSLFCLSNYNSNFIIPVI